MENGPSIGEKLFEWARNALLVMVLILVVGALGGAGWYLYDSRHTKSDPVAASVGSMSIRPATAKANSSSVAASAGSRVSLDIKAQPADLFREDVKDALVKELVAIYPQVSAVDVRSDGRDPAYQESVLKFLDAAEKASPERQPSMLLAADFMLEPVRCPQDAKDKCDQLRTRLAEYKLGFRYSQLGGGSYYTHDLLWQVWKEYPSTEWGERAFILLLLSGWDTSGLCAKGADQFREVIRQGESFLEQHAGSANRALVITLLGQAYATWWELSMGPDAAMEQKVDPGPFKEGAEQARVRAVGYFEKVLELAPKGPLADYSRQVLPPLRNRQLSSMGYAFFCVNGE